MSSAKDLHVTIRAKVITAQDRATSERELQQLVTDLAAILGWSWVHFRPAQTQRGWRTPVEGPLGQGWPDLVLVRPRDRRLVFAELKREGQKPTPAQEGVLIALARLQATDATELNRLSEIPTVEVHVWRPSDLSSGAIEEVLR